MRRVTWTYETDAEPAVAGVQEGEGRDVRVEAVEQDVGEPALVAVRAHDHGARDALADVAVERRAREALQPLQLPVGTKKSGSLGLGRGRRAKGGAAARVWCHGRPYSAEMYLQC